MKEDWNKLGDEFAGSSSVLIGDVDCTADGESMCTHFDVQGYPTIKYFVDGSATGTDYRGGRDFESLVQHVRDHLEPACDVKNNPQDCTEKEQKYIEKMSKVTAEERNKQLARLQGMVGKSMKAELKTWLSQRLHILKSLGAQVAADKEL